VKCPVCNVPMYVVEHDQIELDICAECEGIWFDAGELALLLECREPVLQKAVQVDEALRGCPLCRKKMNKVNIGPYQRVLIDTCADGCGMWFDAHELNQLTGVLAADGWQVQSRLREFLCEMFPAKGE